LVSLKHGARIDTDTGERSRLAQLRYLGQWIVGGWDRTGAYRVFAQRGSDVIVVQRAETGATVVELPSNDVTACAVSAEAIWCASGGEDGTVELFTCATAERRVLHRHAGAVSVIAFVERAGQLVVVSAGVGGSLVAHMLDGARVHEQSIAEIAGASELLGETRYRPVHVWYAQLVLAERWAGEGAPVVAQWTSGDHVAVTHAGHTARLPLAGPFVAHPHAAIWASHEGLVRWEA
jgi:hypothetical protein